MSQDSVRTTLRQREHGPGCGPMVKMQELGLCSTAPGGFLEGGAAQACLVAWRCSSFYLPIAFLQSAGLYGAP